MGLVHAHVQAAGGEALLAGLQQLIFEVPAVIIFSLFIAVVLNQKMLGRAMFRAIFFIPVILSTGLMETIESTNVLSEYMGEASGINDGSGQSTGSELVSALDIEKLFSGMVIGDGLITYVTTAINNIFNIVNHSGVQILIFLAGLQSISPAIYEACRIDGATGWETFWKVTLPMVSPMILVNTIYTVIDAFTSSTNSVMTFISKVAAETNGDVRSSAMSWMYFGIALAFIGICSFIISKAVKSYE